jgi:hypothetical protein
MLAISKLRESKVFIMETDDGEPTFPSISVEIQLAKIADKLGKKASVVNLMSNFVLAALHLLMTATTQDLEETMGIATYTNPCGPINIALTVSPVLLLRGTSYAVTKSYSCPLMLKVVGHLTALIHTNTDSCS